MLKKSKQDNKTLFINASNEFVKSGNKNKLTEANQQRILNAYKERKDNLYFATLVNNTDVATNDYNLSVTSYVEQEDTREIVDITALNAKIEEIVIRQKLLRTDIDAIVAELEGETI